MLRLLLIGSLVAASSAAATPSKAPIGGACSAGRLRELPLTERPASGGEATTLVVLLTGDGGWAAADEELAAGLRAKGASVVGLNMRAYLGARKTPQAAANDVSCIVESYSARWRLSRLMLIGYSRGADIAPFVVNRWPAELRDRLTMVALLSLSKHANFQFHLIDLIRDSAREDDIPVGPELERLRGLRIVCIHGSDDTASGCQEGDPTLMRVIVRPGGHRLNDGMDLVMEALLPGLVRP